LGYLAPTDRIIMNRDQQFAEAKQEVLNMVEAGYTAPNTKGNVYAGGKTLLGSVKVEVYSLQQAGFISEHDAVIANWLGWVLCGGDLSEPAWMDEQYFLDLEMEAVLELGGMTKTHDRMAYILQHGTPLRN
jgi:3-hydroxyacyl-CoA dehydrogenase